MKADPAIPWNKLRIIRRYDLYESKLKQLYNYQLEDR